MASHRACLGEMEAAFRHAQLSANAWRQAGDRHNQSFTEFMQAAYLGFMGKFPQSLEISQKIILQGHDCVDPQIQCWGLTAQGGVLRGIGLIDQAIMSLDEAVVLAKSIRDYGDRIEAGGDLGRCYTRQGRFEEAMSELREAKQIYGKHRTAWGYDLAVFNGLAEVYLAMVEHNPGDRARNLKEAEQACREALKHAKVYGSGLPEAMRLQGTCEALKGKLNAAQKWWINSLALAEKQKQHYDIGMAHLEMGRRLRDRAHLEKAEAVFGELGAQWDLARAREALREIT